MGPRPSMAANFSNTQKRFQPRPPAFRLAGGTTDTPVCRSAPPLSPSPPQTRSNQLLPRAVEKESKPRVKPSSVMPLSHFAKASVLWRRGVVPIPRASAPPSAPLISPIGPIGPIRPIFRKPSQQIHLPQRKRRAPFKLAPLVGCINLPHPPMAARRNEHTSSPLTRTVNVLLLLGWLLSSNGLAPALTLLAASFDRCHHVKVGNSSEGEVRVVLTHEGMDASQGVHVHSPLTTLMMVFAQAPTSQKSDHILAFQSLADLGRPTERDVLSVATTIPAAAMHYVLAKPPAPPRRERSVPRAQAPAWSPGLQLQAGKTLLQC